MELLGSEGWFFYGQPRAWEPYKAAYQFHVPFHVSWVHTVLNLGLYIFLSEHIIVWTWPPDSEHTLVFFYNTKANTENQEIYLIGTVELETFFRVHFFLIILYTVLAGGVRNCLIFITPTSRHSWPNGRIWQRDSKCETTHKEFQYHLC